VFLKHEAFSGGATKPSRERRAELVFLKHKASAAGNLLAPPTV
jgi:hypothetical protein